MESECLIGVVSVREVVGHIVIVFFSSRRRHTRYWRDWSSDVCSSDLTDSLMALPRTALHSLVVLRHGKVAYECYPQPFSAESGHTLYSCSKTFVAAAIGIAIDEGRLRVDSHAAHFFPTAQGDSRNYSRKTIVPFTALG